MAPTGRGKNGIKSNLTKGHFVDSDSVNDVSTMLSDQAANNRRATTVNSLDVEHSCVNNNTMMSDDDDETGAAGNSEFDQSSEISNKTLFVDAEDQENFFKSALSFPASGKHGSNIARVLSKSLSQNVQPDPPQLVNLASYLSGHSPVQTVSQTNINSNLDNQVRLRFFPSNYKGKFIVYIRENGTPLSHISISKYICTKYGAKILEIAKMNKFKIRVEAADAETANKLVKDHELTNKYRVDVPAKEVEINGVISLSDISLKDLVENGEGIFSHPGVPRAKIVHAYRLRKAYVGPDGITEYKDSDMIRVTFSGQALPKTVMIFGLRTNVKMFYPKMMLCDKCLGYNHTSKYCTSPSRCSKCGESHLTASCLTLQPKCVYCDEIGGHTNGVKCPILIKRSEKMSKNVNRQSKFAYSALRRQTESIVCENPYGSLDESSESEEEFVTFAQAVSGARPKRPRHSKPEKKKTNVPPAKRIPIENPQNTDNRNKTCSQGPAQLRTTNSNCQDSLPWLSNLRASIFNFVKSFQWPQLWEKIVLDVLGQLLDNVLPKISSFVSSFLPNLFCNGQS
jgi:hypothetical protein